MSILKQIHYIAETKMSVEELMKPNATTGEERIEILLKRIQDGEPLQLEAGGEIVVDPVKSKEFVDVLKTNNRTKIRQFVKQGNKYPKIIITKDGKELPITALKKAEYFGGGAAAKGATAETTAQQESTQAMVVALAAKLGRNITLDDLTIENLVKAKGGYDVDTDVSHAAPFINDRKPSGWAPSLVNTANKLRKYMNPSMVVHRGSAWVKTLEKMFNRLNKGADGKKIFAGKDKWNPADIWIVDKDTTIPSKINDLVELNAWLQEMYEEGKVIGVSLKKTPKETQMKTFNNKKDLDNLLTVSVKDLLVSKTNKLFKSISSHIIFEHTIHIRDILNEKNMMDIRSFKAGTDVNAELKGKYASGGKIGFGPMNSLLKRKGLPELTHRNDIGKLLKVDIKQKAREKGEEYDRVEYYRDVIEKIIDMAKEVDPKIAEEAKGNLEEVAKTMKFPQLASKYQAVELIHNLKKAPEEKQRDFIQGVIQYASSQDELSSIFAKVW